MRSSFSLVFTVLVALTSCKGPRPDTSVTVSPEQVRAEAPVSASTLGPGDVVEVRVYQEADLSGTFRVSPEGTIDYPLCGRVSVAGKTSSQAADVLTGCLGAKYVRHPSVSVQIREYNSKKIFVLGQVTKPGTFPYEDHMSIVQAITLAGGFLKTAAPNSTNVTRVVEGKETKIRVPVEDIGIGREKNFELQPGDIVFVPESIF